jgi:hypothetical protein
MRSANPFALERPSTDSFFSATPAVLQSIRRLAHWVEVPDYSGLDTVAQLDRPQYAHAALGTDYDAMHPGWPLACASYF